MTTRGIDVRQETDRIVFRVSLKDASGAKVTSGTTELRLLRVEDDGTLDVYDWTTNDFVATGSGTPDDETTMTHRQRRDSTGADVDTGLWTVVLSTLTNFVAGQVYVAQVTNTGAFPESQEREFQFGGVEGASNLQTAVTNYSVEKGFTGTDFDDIIYDNVAVQATGNTTSIVNITASGTPSTNNAIRDDIFEVISGTGVDTTPRRIVAYTVSGGDRLVSVSPPLLTACDNTSVVRTRRGTMTRDTLTVSMSVGSVTGNVGGSVASVTGNVGGSVAGSVVGPVGSVIGDVGGNVNGNVNGNVGGTVTGLLASLRSLFRIALRKDAAIPTDDVVELAQVNANNGTGAGAYANTTESQESIGDRLPALTTGGLLAVSLEAIKDDTTAATILEALLDDAEIGVVDDATFSPTTTVFEVTAASLADADDDTYVPQRIRWSSGANGGKVYNVIASEGTVTNANDKVKLTVEEMPAAPGDGDTFVVYGR